MLARFVLCLLTLLLAIPAAGAASFECGKASTAFERAICAFPELSRQDEILAKSYATALGGLSEQAATVVRKGQRKWLAFAERACTDDAQPLRGDYSADELGCLEQIFNNRIRALEGSRMRSGRRFYQVDRHAVLPDPDATEESWNKVATKELSTPRIDGVDAEAIAFNAMMDKFTAELGYFAGPSDVEIESSVDAATDNQITATVEAVTSRRISLSVNDWWYGHGAAHGNYTITYLHFLTRERRPLVASDIFAGEDWKKPLRELVLAELNRTIEGGIWPESVEYVGEAAADPRNWNFSEDGLVVQFQPYDVTAYAYGAPTATISWEALGQYMADDGSRIASDP